jgi:hypothetical protein
VCGAPAAGWDYDGLDPDERRDTRTGQAWSADIARCRPACSARQAVAVPQ